MSLIDNYNECQKQMTTARSDLLAKQKNVANLQSQRVLYMSMKRDTNQPELRVTYQQEIDKINSQVKELQKEIQDLQSQMTQYQSELDTYEIQLAEMYTPASNITTTTSDNKTGIQINQTKADLAPYSDTQMKVDNVVEGKSYEDINGMKDAYSGLSSATDYQKALGSETSDLFKSIYHSANIYTETETDLFHNRYRYGVLNAYQTLTNSREFLFFTKPDLNIIPSSDPNNPVVDVNGNSIDHATYLNGVLQNYPYWIELCQRYPGVVECLQGSLHLGGRSDPFNHLLANMVQSNIDVPGLSAEMIETPTNMYGVGYNYRGSSEASDDGFDFSLEFKDTKYLPVYNFFKAYEEYQTLKHHGVIAPHIQYIYDKVLHDQYSIYKFVVGDDGETIIYYAKYYGVKSKSLPRDVFNANTYDNGLSYSVDFNAAFVEDMNPLILSDFNELSYAYWNSKKNFIDVYDFRYDKVDNRAANAAVVVREVNGQKGYQIMGKGSEFHYDNIDTNGDGNPKSHLKEPGGFCYKLKWKGDASV